VDDNLDKMGPPDKTLENVTGTLHYFDEMKMWGIYYSIPGVVFNDRDDIYLIKEINTDFPFEEGKNVIVSGHCYLAGEVPFTVFAGETVYYISVTNLIFNEIDEPDKTLQNVTGTLHYFDEMEMWGIYYSIPGVVFIDRDDLYLIKEINTDFIFEEGKDVIVSGYCYLAGEVPFPISAGETVYYIIVTNLT
jgi:hypothetical protein